MPGRGFWRSVAGRLYVALTVLLLSLLAASTYTIIYASQVATSAESLATTSIDSVRAADDFDETLDEHRRAVASAVDSHGNFALDRTVLQLQEYERELADNPGLPQLALAPSPGIALAARQGLEDLRRLSRQILTLAASSDRSAVAASKDAYLAHINAMEVVVTNWKKEMREATAAELDAMKRQAVLTRHLSLALILCGCVIGVAAVLVSRGVLQRLRHLTRAMLSLAGGELATDVPYCGASDEIGRLADALEVFRDNAIRVQASETKLTTAFENMVEGILLVSPDQVVVLNNQKAVQMLGLPARADRSMTIAKMLGYLHAHGWPDDLTAKLGQRLAGVGSREGIETFDICLPDERAYTVTAVMMPDQHLLLTIEDTTERRASAARITHLAYHDTLTELPNRAMLQERLSLAVEDALGKDGIGMVLLMCDLDMFKDVNDTYGHAAGDELLCQVAQRMRENTRRTDVLARIGGDEFAIVHLVGSGPEEVYVVADRIVSALSQPFDIHGNVVRLGVSVGIARAPADATNVTDLMKRADLALYAAKQAGRGRFVVYDAGMAERLELRRVIAAEMRQALGTEFHLCYQPQVDLRTRRILGFEALARWIHPVRGPISPATFIPIAEESGLIVQLGAWALQTACREAAGWDGETRIAVNVSPQQLHEEGFIDTVRSVLAETGLPPDRLELEITETAMLNDGERMLAVMEALHAMGVHLALDDFGTGYSALGYLQKFPFDKIKIDQSFVRELGDKEESDVIVRTVAGLGVNLGIQTIAEGIETEDQARRILEASCYEGQGYLFSRPVEASAVRKLLGQLQTEPCDLAASAEARDI